MLVTLNKHPFTGVAQRQRAGLIILRSHDRDVSPVLLHFARFTETRGHSSRDEKHEHTLTPLSSSEERQAHNLEVTGSTPVGGNSTLHQLYRSWSSMLVTLNKHPMLPA